MVPSFISKVVTTSAQFDKTDEIVEIMNACYDRNKGQNKTVMDYLTRFQDRPRSIYRELNMNDHAAERHRHLVGPKSVFVQRAAR